MRRPKKGLPEKEYGKLKGAMRALRKKNSELRPDGRDVPSRVFRHSPLPKTAYELCEELTYIFSRPISKKKACKEIGIWADSVRLDGLNCFKNFPATSEKRMEEITDYFIGRQTGGFAEGSNNKIRVIRRAAMGYSTSEICFNVYLLILKDILCSDVTVKYDILLPRKIPESLFFWRLCIAWH